MSSGGLGARAATEAALCGAAAGAVGPEPRPLRSLGPCRLWATAVCKSCRAALRGCVAKTSGRWPPTVPLIGLRLAGVMPLLVPLPPAVPLTSLWQAQATARRCGRLALLADRSLLASVPPFVSQHGWLLMLTAPERGHETLCPGLKICNSVIPNHEGGSLPQGMRTRSAATEPIASPMLSPP